MRDPKTTLRVCRAAVIELFGSALNAPQHLVYVSFMPLQQQSMFPARVV